MNNLEREYTSQRLFNWIGNIDDQSERALVAAHVSDLIKMLQADLPSIRSELSNITNVYSADFPFEWVIARLPDGHRAFKWALRYNKRWARALAREHQSLSGVGALCDWCTNAIPRGGGYLINPAVLFPPYSVESPEVVCEDCFERQQPRAWDASGRAHTILKARMELHSLARSIKEQGEGNEKKWWQFWK